MAIQVIINQAGPLPIKATFNAISDSPLFLEVNGSIWSGAANNLIGIQVDLDGQGVGAAQIFNNGSTTHRAVVPAYIPIQLTQGQHTLVLSQMTGTTNSDQNDFYTAVIHY
ncbi:MAG: hypothetical protein IPN42_01895 [Methylococcaceae bacterium]|nr:hypothetical protein [Methylococcaceae bacterium]